MRNNVVTDAFQPGREPNGPETGTAVVRTLAVTVYGARFSNTDR